MAKSIPKHTPEQRARYYRARRDKGDERVKKGLCRECGVRDIEADFWDKKVVTCLRCRSYVRFYQRSKDFCVDCQAHDFHRDDCPVAGFNQALRKALAHLSVDLEADNAVEVECPSPVVPPENRQGEAPQVLKEGQQPAAVEVGRSHDEGLPESGPAEIDATISLGTTYTTLLGLKRRLKARTADVRLPGDGPGTP